MRCLPSESPPPTDALVDRVGSRPDLRALGEEAGAGDLDARAAGRWWLPDLTLSAGYKGVGVAGEQLNGYIAGIAIPLPVFDRNQDEAARAEGRSRQARGRLTLETDLARAEVRGLRIQATRLADAARRFRSDATSTSSGCSSRPRPPTGAASWASWNSSTPSGARSTPISRPSTSSPPPAGPASTSFSLPEAHPMRRSQAALVVVLLVTACRPGGKDEHGHGAEARVESFTHFGDATELFVEFEPLVAGRETKMAAHLTRLVRLEAPRGGKGHGHPVGWRQGGAVRGRRALHAGHLPARSQARRGRQAPARHRGHHAGGHRRPRPRRGRRPREPGGRSKGGRAGAGAGRLIAFLMEQQWRTDFGMAAAEERPLRPSVVANGVLRPRSDGEAHVVAPVTGRLVSVGQAFPHVGMAVKKDQVLATIAPGWARRRTRPRWSRRRARRRSAWNWPGRSGSGSRGCSPSRRFRASRGRGAERRVTRQEEATAAARRLAQYQGTQRASGEGATGKVELRSPVTGVVAAVSTAPGAFVEEGKELFHVVDPDRLWLEVQVPEADIGRIGKPSGAWFEVQGFDRPFTVDPKAGGKVVAFGGVVDAQSRTTPLIFEVGNPGRALRVGMFAKVHVLSGQERKGLAIPASAVVDDGKQEVAYVLVSGEAFERRPLNLGVRDGELGPGARRARARRARGHTGAWQVRLAAAAGAHSRARPRSLRGRHDRRASSAGPSRTASSCCSARRCSSSRAATRRCSMPVDVFPDLTAPTVTVLTEAHGMAPEEVEAQVAFPIETAGERRHGRAAGPLGLRGRHLHRLGGVRLGHRHLPRPPDRRREAPARRRGAAARRRPADAGARSPRSWARSSSSPHAPTSTTPMELKTTADWVLRKRLLAIPGVSQVIPIGGEMKQYQVLLRPERLSAYGIAVDEVVEALRETNENTSAGFSSRAARSTSSTAWGGSRRAATSARRSWPSAAASRCWCARWRGRIGPALKRGEGSHDAKPAVVLGVQKQPGANTLELTRRIDAVLDEIQADLPEGDGDRPADLPPVGLHRGGHPQRLGALRDGAIWSSSSCSSSSRLPGHRHLAPGHPAVAGRRRCWR